MFEVDPHIGGRSRTPDPAVADLARRQHGVVARRQLRKLGLGPRAIEHRLQIGRLHRLHRGVYAVGHTRIGPFGRQLAAVLACGPGALLSHAGAAWLWDLIPSVPRLPDVLVESRIPHRPGIRLHHTREIAVADRALRNGIPVTSIARTLRDNAASLSAPRLARVIEQAERLELFNLVEVDELLSRSRGKRGVKALRVALATYRDPPFTRSELERRFLDLARRARLPTPSLNAVVAGYEVDVWWPTARLAVELDTFEFHGTRAAFERDRRRDEDLKLAGIEVLRITGQRIDRDPDLVAGRIRALLDRRTRET